MSVVLKEVTGSEHNLSYTVQDLKTGQYYYFVDESNFLLGEGHLDSASRSSHHDLSHSTSLNVKSPEVLAIFAEARQQLTTVLEGAVNVVRTARQGIPVTARNRVRWATESGMEFTLHRLGRETGIPTNITSVGVYSREDPYEEPVSGMNYSNLIAVCNLKPWTRGLSTCEYSHIQIEFSDPDDPSPIPGFNNIDINFDLSSPYVRYLIGAVIYAGSSDGAL